MAAKSKGGFWQFIGKFADVQQLFSVPITIGISSIGATLSQHVPFISAFGLFGLFCVAVGIFLLLSICVWLRPKSKNKARSGTAVENGMLSRILDWKGWKWMICAACVIVSLWFVDSHPPLPAGINPALITLPIASYREMRESTIVGRTVILNAVPRSKLLSTVIEAKTFEHCLILGPAVVGLIYPNTFHATGFDIAEPTRESILMETKSPVSVGVIGLSKCTFEYCKFNSISFCGTHEQIEEMRRSIPDYYPSKAQ